MPELPEVETVRRRLESLLTGRTLDEVVIDDWRLVRSYDPVEVAAELRGERVAEVGRRGKYLILSFESGRTLLVHLRMTGSFLSAPRASSHIRAVLTLDDGTEVGYRDVRRFGTWLLLEPGELDGYLAKRVGEEPLLPAFTSHRLAERLAGRRAPVKSALLDQRTLAGLGNIYVDESLWRARIHPLRPARALDASEIRRLHKAIRVSLEAGLARQGATLRDYALPDGSSGAAQDEFKAYGREGEPCDHCGTPIEKIRLGGRGTWFCPRCQPAVA